MVQAIINKDANAIYELCQRDTKSIILNGY